MLGPRERLKADQMTINRNRPRRFPFTAAIGCISFHSKMVLDSGDINPSSNNQYPLEVDSPSMNTSEIVRHSWANDGPINRHIHSKREMSSPRFYRVLYDYLEDNSYTLSISKHQLVECFIEEHGWLYGTVNGRFGWFPANHSVLESNLLNHIAPSDPRFSFPISFPSQSQLVVSSTSLATTESSATSLPRHFPLFKPLSATFDSVLSLLSKSLTSSTFTQKPFLTSMAKDFIYSTFHSNDIKYRIGGDFRWLRHAPHYQIDAQIFRESETTYYVLQTTAASERSESPMPVYRSYNNDNSSTSQNNSIVRRRYSNFCTLQLHLQSQYKLLIAPTLPPKLLINSHNSIEERRRWLMAWSNLILQHPVFCIDRQVQLFFDLPNELARTTSSLFDVFLAQIGCTWFDTQPPKEFDLLNQAIMSFSDLDIHLSAYSASLDILSRAMPKYAHADLMTDVKYNIRILPTFHQVAYLESVYDDSIACHPLNAMFREEIDDRIFTVLHVVCAESLWWLDFIRNTFHEPSSLE